MTDIATVSNAEATAAAVDAARRGEGWPCSSCVTTEAPTIAKVVPDFRAVLPEATIYVYDNNSTDGTADIAAAAGAVVRRSPARAGNGALHVPRHRRRVLPHGRRRRHPPGRGGWRPHRASGGRRGGHDRGRPHLQRRLRQGRTSGPSTTPWQQPGASAHQVIYGYAFEDVMMGIPRLHPRL